MTPARIWLGGFQDSDMKQTREESKPVDKATTEPTTDLAPTTSAKAWLGEFIIPGSSTPKELMGNAEPTEEAFFKKDVDADKPAQPGAAPHSTTQHGRKSAPCLMTMDSSGYNVEMSSGYFGPS